MHSSWSLLPAIAAVIVLSSCEKPAEAPHTYLMGEKAELGHIAYTVFDTQWLLQIPQSPTPRIPQHRFFLVRISARNHGTANVLVPNVTIEDDRGKAYPELNNGEGVGQWIGYLRQVKPAESVQGYVVFDAPPGHYKMRVKDEGDEKSAFIDLPLSLGGDTPAVPLPGEK